MELPVYSIVLKLIGPINPVGESHTDDKRYENLRATSMLVENLVSDIQDVVNANRNAHEASRKKAFLYAKSILETLGIDD